MSRAQKRRQRRRWWYIQDGAVVHVIHCRGKGFFTIHNVYGVVYNLHDTVPADLVG